MASIDGLISGLDTTGLIKDILRFQQAPIDQLQGRIKTETDRRTALLGFTAKLLALQTKANLLARAAGFTTPAVSSSNEQVLTAQGSQDLPAGSYTFRVKQLAQGSQYISGGFASSSQKIGAGLLTIDAAGGAADRPSDLDFLNGGLGVRRGSIRVTNRAGVSQVVDLSTALSVDEVLSAINSAPGLQVTAAIAPAGGAHPGEGLVLTDSSGGLGSLKVEEVAGGNTARDLGILRTVAASSLEGSALAALGRGLSLSALNDGLGVRVNAGADLSITQTDGATFTVDLSGKTTVGELLDAINGAAGNTGVTVAISGRSLVATDSSGGGGVFSIASVGSGHAAADLGLDTAASGGTISGSPVLADLDSALLKTLRGGSGISAGSVLLTNRAGASQAIDLSSARTLQEVLRALNANSLGVSASFNERGDGLLLTDSSGGSGLFKVEEVAGGSTAQNLGILAASGVASDQLQGQDLQIQYVGENTLLSSLNAGRGVAGGSIRISDPAGKAFTVNLAQEKTVGEVIEDVNGAARLAGSDLVASIDSTGNGILLSSAAGSGTLSVAEVAGGTTARDLNLLGNAPAATPRAIDGSFERRIAILADDTLATLASRINALGVGVTASVLNDGSPLLPQRLQLTSGQPGAAGRILASTSGGTALDMSPTALGRDAVLFYGGDGGRPVVVRSSQNQFRDVLKGLSVTAHDVSASPVVITATQDVQGAAQAVKDVVDSYNDAIDELRNLTRFDPATGESGPLLGEAVLRTVESQISDAILGPIPGLASGKSLASQVGLRVVTGGKLTFDEQAFLDVAGSDPDTIRRIFTQSRGLEERTLLKDFGNGQGIGATAGGADLRIRRRNGTSFEVDLSSAKTVRDLLTAIRNAPGNGGTVTAALAPTGRSIQLTDSTSGGNVFKVEARNGSAAFQRLGLDRGPDADGGGLITGREIDLTSDTGVARRLYDTLNALTDASGGLLQGRADSFQSEIDDLGKRSDTLKERMASRETDLRQQFARLEVLLGKNQNTQSRLAATLGGLVSGK
jgi:flagellar hook-associated protein 2